MRTIESGSQSNIQEASREVFRSQKEWDDWWQRHNTTVEFIDGEEIKPAAPAVDFASEMVIVATLGMRSSGGYSIEFAGIRHEEDTLIASYKTTSPGPDDRVTMALTAPYTIIAVPKHDGPVRFVEAK